MLILIDFSPLRSGTFTTKWGAKFIDRVKFLPAPPHLLDHFVEIFFKRFWCAIDFQAVIS